MRWIALLVLACACGKHEAKEPHWSYDGETGPEHWAELNPEWEIATRGKRQSPIELGVAKPGDAGKLEFQYDKFFENVPPAGERRTIPDFVADLSRILPEDLDHNFHYSGSLTTPPCTEGVEWYILKTHKTLSPRQIALYRKHYAGNNRPLQPLYGRSVEVD